MLKKMRGKTLQNKLLAALHVTGHAGKQSVKVEFTKVTEKNLTTSDTTVKVVWIMSLLVLSAAMQIGSGNRKDLN